jgi:soluble lytic murein transglycosylase
MNRRHLIRLAVIASGALALAAAEAAPKREKVPLPRPRPVAGHKLPAMFSSVPLARVPAALATTVLPSRALAYARPDDPITVSPTDTTPARDVEMVNQAAELVRRGKFSDATALKASIGDPLARKLVEWIILRGDQNHSPGFERYAAFVAENPSWPSIGLLVKRAEAALWDDKRDSATVLRYFANTPPRSAKGSFALARALLARGDQRGAERHVREAWRNESFSSGVERMALDLFSDLLRPEDHRARMHRRLYAEDHADGLRIAQRLTSADQAIAKAWVAVNRGAKNAKALLDSVPHSARHDPGYIFALVRWLRRDDKFDQAAKALSTAPNDADKLVSTDEWWIERRLIMRKLIEAGHYQAAYRVARDAPVPEKGNYRVDQQFSAGWIALRFLKEPATATRHFAVIAERTRNPTALARAGYWLGRTAEAMGQTDAARSHYAAAAQFRTAYYGQLAHARLGETHIALPLHPEPSAERRKQLARVEIVRALDIIYAIGERDLAIPFVSDVAERNDPSVLAALGEITQRHRDARASMLLGKDALNKGLPLAQYAFPVIGLPNYKAIGPEIESSLLYSIARQESSFNPKTVSIADAMGLMQVTPAAGRFIARRFDVKYDKKRLLEDSVYNVQMGAAELGSLLREYGGSYILTFVGYNAGRGRVRDWIARFGDPRDPKVDPVDWVEMIPFAETRNYVQRIMENMQVYRARFDESRRLTIEADLRRGSAAN